MVKLLLVITACFVDPTNKENVSRLICTESIFQREDTAQFLLFYTWSPHILLVQESESHC